MDKNTLEKYKVDIFNVKDDNTFHPVEAQYGNCLLYTSPSPRDRG